MIEEISASIKSRKWPEQQNVHTYNWQDIVGIIGEPKLFFKRGMYGVTQLD